ncbi:MAG: TlpA disulfide reductase family protein [Verrucomicrobia bacterium]|nr:TlpA disulfide reductase family protein [Verrucomicrobiota bacterium]
MSSNSLMRILSYLGLFLTGSASLLADFSIQGTISHLDPGTKLLLFRQDLDARSETEAGGLVIQADHTFEQSFDGEPGFFNLEIPRWGRIPLAIDSGQDVTITVHSNNPADFEISGSTDSDVLLAYEAFRKDSLTRLVYPPRELLNRATANGVSTEELAPLAQAEVDGYNAHKRELNDFTIEHAGSLVALYATSLRWDSDYRISEIQKQVDAFADTHPGLLITGSMQERLRLFGLTAIGAMGAPLSGRDFNGEEYSLEDFRGKVVLVDFWASWCVPCRVENRHYPKLLETYSKHGFEVFGINLDDSRSSWMRTSHQDEVTWPQISDLLGLKSPMAQAYNVTALPMSFLLDEEGRIIDRNLRGEELSKRLGALFGGNAGK